MPATSDQRALATVIGALDDAELARLLSIRGIPSSAPWRDVFDAAEAMLEPASIARGLATLARPDAIALSRAVSDAEPVAATRRHALAAAGLADDEGHPYLAVRAAVRERPVVAGADTDVEPAPATAVESSAAAERAFTHTTSLADILLRTLEKPLVRIGNGGLGAADRRALVDSGAAADAATADLLVGLAEAVGLLAGGERSWTVTPAARTWVTTGTIQRWAAVAERLRDALPEGLRTHDGGWIGVHTWALAYPYDPAWPARAAVWRRRMVAWGLVTPAGAPPAWSQQLTAGGAPDTTALQELLPPEVDRVYLQNDLTAIAPGPLAPHLDVRLRGMARRESRAQASSYRFDADTVAAAITAGETAESMRAFLGQLSLTGLPQPLAYVIERTADRHGRVRVGTDAATGRSRVASDDRSTLDTIAVDQALRHLGFVHDGDDLVSRVAGETVFWALADARYPVVAVDADGAPRTLERARVAAAAPAPDPGEIYAPLIGRLHSAGSDDDGDAAWLERELDQAARSRSIVDVVVSLPDGSPRTFRLEATGFGGGRLRGRDRGADVERTLPLSNIVSVHPVA